MISGIKVGPENWKKIFTDFRPRCCEVWFRIDWLERYREMFESLRQESIPAGLHFWGMLPKGICPNLAFPEKNIRKSSLELVKKTIDVASDNELCYVNIHPGSYQLVKLNLDKSFMRPVPGQETSKREGDATLFENVHELNNYAQKRGVLFLVETIPSREPLHWRNLIKGRLKTQDVRNVPVSVIKDLAQQGYFVCNDFCHTAADVVSEDREYLFTELLAKTQELAAQTRLVHVNTMPPPFNGTDGHLGIRRQDFTDHIFPSREQLKSLLSLFGDRDDVWAIPEPFSDQVENTRALEEIVDEIREER